MSRGRTPSGRRRFGILLSDLAGGGTQRISLELASGLIRRGHEVDLVLEHLVCDYPEEVPPESRIFYFRFLDGVEDSHAIRGPLPVVPQPLFRGPYPFRVRFPRLSLSTALSRKQLSLLITKRTGWLRWAVSTAIYLDRERPDAVIAGDSTATAGATMAARAARRRVRIVGTLHSTKRRRRFGRASLSFPLADAAVGVSRGLTAQLKEWHGVPTDRVHCIYNPVVSAKLVRNADLPAVHPWLDGAGPQVVLAAGRLVEEKDFSTLLAAFAKLLVHRPARLIVLGEGGLRPMLTAQAEELRIAGHVDFPGFVENPYAFMAKANLFVLSSRQEGLGNVLIEAMACGCSVVSTDCPFGPGEILEDGRWGELVPVGDAKALSEAMRRALDRPRPGDELRKRASAFGVDRAVDRYEALLLDRLPIHG